MQRMAKLGVALMLALFAQVSAAGGGLWLVMFDAPDCPFCAAWDRDVGVVYAKTEEGRRAPLLRAHAFTPPPACWSMSAPVEFSPTFVLLDGREEVARIEGYHSEDQFWGLLGMALAEVPERPGAAPPTCALDSEPAAGQ